MVGKTHKGLDPWLDTIICGDSASLLKALPKDSVDLVVTSPPYAEQRKGQYQSYSEKEYVDWFMGVADGVMRCLKPTGSFILNIKEHARKGMRSNYVYDLVLAMSEKYRWVEDFVWNKPNPFPTGNKKRLKDAWEHCYQFTKSKDYKFKPNNALIPSTLSKNKLEKELKRKPHASICKNGSGFFVKPYKQKRMVRPSTVITIPTTSTSVMHCATFPIQLPAFFIKLMTDKGDVVLDPFMGSGTTALACIDLDRRYIGFDASRKYCDYAKSRIEENYFSNYPNNPVAAAA